MDLEGKARNSQVQGQLQESERAKMPRPRALTMKNTQLTVMRTEQHPAEGLETCRPETHKGLKNLRDSSSASGEVIKK